MDLSAEKPAGELERLKEYLGKVLDQVLGKALAEGTDLVKETESLQVLRRENRILKAQLKELERVDDAELDLLYNYIGRIEAKCMDTEKRNLQLQSELAAKVVGDGQEPASKPADSGTARDSGKAQQSANALTTVPVSSESPPQQAQLAIVPAAGQGPVLDPEADKLARRAEILETLGPALDKFNTFEAQMHSMAILSIQMKAALESVQTQQEADSQQIVKEFASVKDLLNRQLSVGGKQQAKQPVKQPAKQPAKKKGAEANNPDANKGGAKKTEQKQPEAKKGKKRGRDSPSRDAGATGLAQPPSKRTTLDQNVRQPYVPPAAAPFPALRASAATAPVFGGAPPPLFGGEGLQSSAAPIAQFAFSDKNQPASQFPSTLAPQQAAPFGATGMGPVESLAVTSGQISAAWQTKSWRCPLCCVGFDRSAQLARHFLEEDHVTFAKDTFTYSLRRNPKDSRPLPDSDQPRMPFPFANRLGEGQMVRLKQEGKWNCQICGFSSTCQLFLVHMWSQRHKAVCKGWGDF